MELTKRVFKKETGWQYEIYQDGVPFIKQDFNPGADGFLPMTEEEANTLAEKILRRMQNGSS